MEKKFDLFRVDIEKNRDLDNSKLFGSPVFPKNYMRRHKLNSDYYFAQINLSYDSDGVLPTEGMLYFFLHFKGTQVKPIVKYSNEELYEVVDDVNEIFNELDFKDALQMVFDHKGKSGFLFSEIDQELPELLDEDDYIVLLKVDPLNVLASDFPIFNNPDDEIYFIMKKEDYINRNFKNVKLIFHGS
ncbi:MAG: DUF1963 domain-containing protein [Bacilli bacterium]|nr:DUF1963 domain-containing protein [Bacilli bacterium]